MTAEDELLREAEAQDHEWRRSINNILRRMRAAFPEYLSPAALARARKLKQPPPALPAAAMELS